MSPKNNHNNLFNQLLLLKKEIANIKGKGFSLTKLKSQQDFMAYADMLYSFSKRYMVMIISCDTPVGSYFGVEAAVKLCDMGLKINLENKFRSSYAAIIDAGEVLFEKIEERKQEPVEYSCIVEEVAIKVLSIGFYVPRNYIPTISINGINYSPNKRGLNFVVYDKVTQTVLDAVNFDTYSATFTCNRPSFAIDEILNYQKEHPDVSIVSITYPGFPQKDLSVNEQLIRNNSISRMMIIQQPDHPLYAVNKYIDTPEGVVEVLNAPKSYYDLNDVRHFEDRAGKYLNIAGGHRVTTSQPKGYKRTIYLVGGCKMFGVGASDKGTIASILQKKLNEEVYDQGIIVENFGFFLAELEGGKSNDEVRILKNLPAKPGDIIIIDFAHSKEISCVETTIQRPHMYGEIFFDTQLHLTENGNWLVADKIFHQLKEFNLLTSTRFYENMKPCKEVMYPTKYNLDNNSMEELNQYKAILREFYHSTFVPLVGAIVVNCNPFTLGHRYLIEEAALQCDHLIIFVVQEDKSFFTFEDRITLVDKGVSDLSNVTVIPSGRFIISSLTFSDYFNKAEMQDRTIDTSLDVELFAREIAPCLNIKIRFAGTEPYDQITRQYNNKLNHILSKYDIKFIEITRKEIDEKPISATNVRQLMAEKKYDEIARIVPSSTFDYLIKNYCDFNDTIKQFQKNPNKHNNFAIAFKKWLFFCAYYFLYKKLILSNSMQLDNNHHSVFLMYYHLILVVKYRRNVIDKEVSNQLHEIFE